MVVQQAEGEGEEGLEDLGRDELETVVGELEGDGGAKLGPAQAEQGVDDRR